MSKSQSKRVAAQKKGSEKRNKVLVNFILDSSGSMSSVQDETIKGFNTYIAELKKEKKVDYFFSLTKFGGVYQVIYSAVSLDTVSNLTKETYAPDGWTALYDAIGATVRSAEPEAKKVDKVITVIYTDGHENSSKEFTYEQIQKLIAKKEGEGNWTFVYLGATMDAVHVSQNLGIKAGNSYQYSPKHTSAVYAGMARSTNTMSASLDSQTRCFMAKEDRVGIVDAGDTIGGVSGASGIPGNGSLVDPNATSGLGKAGPFTTTIGSSLQDLLDSSKGSWKNLIHKP